MTADPNSGARLQGLLIMRAAAVERQPELWQQRFSSLFSGDLLRLPVLPGSQEARQLQLPEAMSGASAARPIRRRLTELLQTTAQGIGVDISLLTFRQVMQWLEEPTDPQPPAARQCSLLLSIAAAHPAAPMLVRRIGSLGGNGVRLALRYQAHAPRGEGLSWAELVADSHADTRLQPVPLLALRPLNGLYAAESGNTVLPGGWFEVRADTAWLLLELNAGALLSTRSLGQRLAEVLRFADNLIDSVAWPRASLRVDALLNRRIAIGLTGIGDLLLQQGLDPREQSTLMQLRRWLSLVHRCFVRESRRLAHQRGPFPELGINDLLANLAPHYGVAEARRLLRHQSVRHRHLLALSPYVLFPSSVNTFPAAAWLNLLPALACVDSVAMFGRDPRARLGVSDWGRLLQMTSAVATG